MRFRTALATLCLLVPLTTLASLDETISYIDNLLAEGKKVAVLLIDMQYAYRYMFSPVFSHTIIDYQARLLMHLAPKENVIFVDINLSSDIVGQSGLETLPRLQMQLKRKEYLRFFKRGDNAFDKPSVIDGHQDMEGVITGKLGNRLKSEGVTDIIPTGCFDGACIIKTAEGALKEGFNVHVDRDINIVYSTAVHGEVPREDVIRVNTQKWQGLKEKYPNLDMIPEQKQTTCSE